MKNVSFLLISIFALFFISCNQDETNPQEGSNVIGSSTTDEGVVLNLTSTKEALYEGVNNVTFSLGNGQSLSEGGTWKITPVMEMTMDNGMKHMHSTPIKGFDIGSSNTTSGEGQILFVMPTVEKGAWELHIEYIVNDAVEAMWMMPIEVNAVTFETSEANYKTVIMQQLDGSEERIVLGYNFLSGGPEMGANDIEILAFKRIPAMDHGHHEEGHGHDFETYEPYTQLSIKTTPWMPSMSHGSSNNVDPEETEEGVYTGVVNFSMTGDWQIQLNVKDGETEIINEEGLSFYLEF
ncbi:FixH family protein [Flammeovirga agarivorans]|uniref:YtkA-like domain-containing protein n=1 Tax=Flammeovirga agarivorans TaxID=2726742 RepID=A0A7X8SNY1_9BACT|nr:FixH family protein [Flammeovirga agarivorans]NLR93592.1 hypothetical protein [Flammeovirga agarivorans]